MKFSRRDFLKFSGAAAAFTISSCSTVGWKIARDAMPTSLKVLDAEAAADPVLRLMNRGGYGPRPGELERARDMGLEAYLEEQLAPDDLDDSAAELILRGLTYYPMEIDWLLNQDARDVSAELLAATISRAAYSRRQLNEAMVEFWSDHFNIYLRKNQFMPFLKLVDDRDVIRPHALGKFQDLLFASARSPAMLVYLDNVQSSREAPNENYARELMELHTLGVDGGYTQRDVEELARALTGWGTARQGAGRGQFVFHSGRHDHGEKLFLGKELPAGSTDADGLEALAILAAHPSTARFLAFKLVRRFVADDPPVGLVSRVADVYESSDGDIREMLRVVFLSEEFSGAPKKMKRPYTYMVSALRALNADVRWRGYRQLWDWLVAMGQPLFNWPPPDGYPDVSEAWAANLLPRWNFAAALAGENLPGVRIPLDDILQAGDVQDIPDAIHLLYGLLFGSAADRELLAAYENHAGGGDPFEDDSRQRLKESIALMLASPAFQWV